MQTGLIRLGFTLAAVVALVTFGIGLESWVGIPFPVTYRLGCAGACTYLLVRMALDYPGQRWPWIAIGLSVLADAVLLLKLADGPASRGEIMIFAGPAAAIFLAARAVAYPVEDVHQRAVRQQLIVGAVLASVICAILVSLSFVPTVSKRSALPARQQRPALSRGAEGDGQASAG